MVLFNLGQYERAVKEGGESIRLVPGVVVFCWEQVGYYFGMDRFDEARAVLQEALARGLDDGPIHSELYALAFLKGDAAAMRKQLEWAMGKIGVEDMTLATQSDTESYFGRLSRAREFSRQAVEAAMRSKLDESAANWDVDAARREALMGSSARARRAAAAALKLAPDLREVAAGSALAFALAGDLARAQQTADELRQHFPLDTIAQSVELPTIKAANELSQGHAAKAVESLQTAASYELGNNNWPPPRPSCMYPAYIRGEAYLALRDGVAATAEFQKFLNHRGTVLSCPTAALARLGLARAYALQGNNAKARAAYEDFLTLWKDADPDIPILKQAKVEYAKLKMSAAAKSTPGLQRVSRQQPFRKQHHCSRSSLNQYYPLLAVIPRESGQLPRGQQTGSSP